MSSLAKNLNDHLWSRVGQKFRFDLWTLGVLLIAMLIAVPIIAVIGLALSPSGDIWGHLLSTVLFRYIRTTLGLMLGVGLGTLTIGVGTAWLVTMCRFPGRAVFEWALLLPLAMPAYIIAYVYTDILEFAGPVQETLRAVFSWETGRDYWFPEIRSLEGAISMMTLVLYPYVYLLARVAFLEQSVCVTEVSRTLGRGPWRSFFSVALPLARPSVVVGVSLVLMETLNDFGTVDFFAVEVFTTGIYDVWLNMNNTAGAAQLASAALIFVVLLICSEKWARKGQSYFHTTTKYRTIPGYQLTRSKTILAFTACFLPILLGFLIPVSILIRYASLFYEESLSSNFFQFTRHSLTLSAASASIAILIGLFMAYGVRLSRSSILQGYVQFASLGYAVPGAVLAVGVLIPMGKIDVGIQSVVRDLWGLQIGLFFSGTILAVTYGYLVRFLALSYGTVNASLTKVTPNMEGAARTLGMGPGRTLIRVHLPLIRGGLLAAGVLVFVDCMKELTMTIILRPFNYETLATFVHQYASTELLEESALGALTIVASGILPVIFLSVSIRQSRPGQNV